MKAASGPARRAAPIVLTFLACATGARAAVTVVSPGNDPQGNLQYAIDTAADGDTLLLMPGDWTTGASAFGHYVVSGKGLTIAPVGPEHELLDSLEILGLPAGSRMVLERIDIHRLSPYDSQTTWDDALLVYQCAGTVWVQDAAISAGKNYVGGVGGFYQVQPGWSGVRVRASSDVHLTRCQLSGGEGHEAWLGGIGSYGPAPGGHGARVEQSTVTFHDCTLAGGSGGALAGGYLDNEDGAGLLVDSATVLLAGSSAAGFGADPGNVHPGDGLAVSGASTVWLRDSTTVAGLGAPAALDIDAPAGTVTLLPAPARSLLVPSPLHEQEAATLTVTGQPGDVAFAFAGADGGAHFVTSMQGMLELGAPLLGPLPLGVLPGSPPGTEVVLSLPFHAPSLPAAVDESQTWLLQLAVVADGQPLLENGCSFVLLDAALP